MPAVCTRESARWYLPDSMLRQEAEANPKDWRIVRVRGDAMQPLLSEGDRLVIDTDWGSLQSGLHVSKLMIEGYAVHRALRLAVSTAAAMRVLPTWEHAWFTGTTTGWLVVVWIESWST